MKSLGCTFVGFEQIAALEIKELLGSTAKAGKGVVFFDASDEDLAKLCYKTQSIRTVMRLYADFSFSSLDDLKQKLKSALKGVDLSVFDGRTFRVDCDRSGTHEFTSQQVEAGVGEVFLGQCSGTKVALKDNDLHVLCLVVDDHCYVGLDFAGSDLVKREYKIYGQPDTLNCNFAYCAVRFAGYTGKEVLVDPLCGVGTIPMETALFAVSRSPRFYQKDMFAFHQFMDIDLDELDFDKDFVGKVCGYDMQLRHVSAANKHAKLAGIPKIVTFSRADLEWLDTKLNKESVDLVVSQPPVSGAVIQKKDLDKLYKEFFYQIAFVLKKDGKVVLLCAKPDDLSGFEADFVLEKKHVAYQGARKFTLVVFKKK